jgi:hypothetical protein
VRGGVKLVAFARAAPGKRVQKTVSRSEAAISLIIEQPA